jgi:hypothetical protein
MISSGNGSLRGFGLIRAQQGVGGTDRCPKSERPAQTEPPFCQVRPRFRRAGARRASGFAAIPAQKANLALAPRSNARGAQRVKALLLQNPTLALFVKRSGKEHGL